MPTMPPHLDWQGHPLADHQKSNDDHQESWIYDDNPIPRNDNNEAFNYDNWKAFIDDDNQEPWVTDKPG